MEKMITEADKFIIKQNKSHQPLNKCDKCSSIKNNSFIMPSYFEYNICSYCGTKIIT